MKIRLLAVGQKMPTWVQQTFAEYNGRLPVKQQIELVEIAPIHRSKSISTDKARQMEAQSILDSVKNNEKIVLLDEKGKMISTRNLSESISQWQMNGDDIAIIIGGADGVDKNIKKQAHKTWSLSALTFPHPLVRVIIMEQIYRSYSLLSNHPYHRE